MHIKKICFVISIFQLIFGSSYAYANPPEETPQNKNISKNASSSQSSNIESYDYNSTNSEFTIPNLNSLAELTKYLFEVSSECNLSDEEVGSAEKNILERTGKQSLMDVDVDTLTDEYWKLFSNKTANCRVSTKCIKSILDKMNIENYEISFQPAESKDIIVFNNKSPDRTANLIKYKDKWYVIDFIEMYQFYNKFKHTVHDFLPIPSLNNYIQKTKIENKSICCASVLKPDENRLNHYNPLQDIIGEKEYLKVQNPCGFHLITLGERREDNNKLLLLFPNDIIKNLSKNAKILDIYEEDPKFLSLYKTDNFTIHMYKFKHETDRTNSDLKFSSLCDYKQLVLLPQNLSDILFN